MRVRSLFSFLSLPLAAGTLLSCRLAGDGLPPPSDRIYFPVGLSVSQASDHLLIVNSDFDLQFSQGTIQSLSLELIREITQTPCNTDDDCQVGTKCDDQPSPENGERPAYVCVDAQAPSPCGSLGEKSAAERSITPGRCASVTLMDPAGLDEPLLTDVVQTSAFATQGLLLPRPCVGEKDNLVACDEEASSRLKDRNGESFPERLFLPVRGDTTIHYVDVDDDGHLVCGRGLESQAGRDFQSERAGKSLRCSDDYRIAIGTTYGLSEGGKLVLAQEPPEPGTDENARDPDDPADDFRIQPEPIDLAASEAGRVITVSHQVGGTVSALMNNWLDPPSLVSILQGLPSSPVGLVSVPRGRFPGSALPGDASWDFLLSYRNSTRIDLLHFDDDGLLEAAASADGVSQGEPKVLFRPSLLQSDSTRILTNSSGTHSRGMAADGAALQAALDECASSDEACAEQAREQVSVGIFVTNRSPNSLLLGQTGGSARLASSDLLPRIYDNIPLTAGPSRVVVGPVTLADGRQEQRIYVLCFDDALIYVVHPDTGQVESQIVTGRGPYAMVFDPLSSNAYVAHFTDSTVGVVSLDQRFLHTYGATLATLGRPQSPRASE